MNKNFVQIGLVIAAVVAALADKISPETTWHDISSPGKIVSILAVIGVTLTSFHLPSPTQQESTKTNGDNSQ